MSKKATEVIWDDMYRTCEPLLHQFSSMNERFEYLAGFSIMKARPYMTKRVRYSYVFMRQKTSPGETTKPWKLARISSLKSMRRKTSEEF